MPCLSWWWSVRRVTCVYLPGLASQDCIPAALGSHSSLKRHSPTYWVEIMIIPTFSIKSKHLTNLWHSVSQSYQWQSLIQLLLGNFSTLIKHFSDSQIVAYQMMCHCILTLLGLFWKSSVRWELLLGSIVSTSKQFKL